MLPQPITSQLQNVRRILVAGAGGGFDVVCGLPLFFALEKMGYEVHLANLSFSRLSEATGVNRHGDVLFEVTEQSQGAGYFPERHLCRWFASRLKKRVPVWCFQATGVQPYAASYAYLVERLQIDAVLLIDGGVDSLLRGDEHSLGTPLWDALSVAAVNELKTQSFLASVGFGAERWDKIPHSQALARIAELTVSHALLGVSALLPQTTEAQLFMQAASYIFEQQPEIRPSTIVCSILAALRGEFGERPVNSFTQTTPIWVSPLMNLYWFFDLSEVARSNLYLHRLTGTQTLAEAAERLREFTDTQTPKQWESIPI